MNNEDLAANILARAIVIFTMVYFLYIFYPFIITMVIKITLCVFQYSIMGLDPLIV